MSQKVSLQQLIDDLDRLEKEAVNDITVSSDKESLENISLLIDEKILDHVDRWSLQNDYFAQAVSGKKNIQEYLDFTSAYYDEDNYNSSLSLAHNLYSLYILARKEKFSDELRQYAINFLGIIFDRLGWDKKKNEPHTDSLLRSFAIVGMGKLGDSQIISDAEMRFKNYYTIDFSEAHCI